MTTERSLRSADETGNEAAVERQDSVEKPGLLPCGPERLQLRRSLPVEGKGERTLPAGDIGCGDLNGDDFPRVPAIRDPDVLGITRPGIECVCERPEQSLPSRRVLQGIKVRCRRKGRSRSASRARDERHCRFRQSARRRRPQGDGEAWSVAGAPTVLARHLHAVVEPADPSVDVLPRARRVAMRSPAVLVAVVPAEGAGIVGGGHQRRIEMRLRSLLGDVGGSRCDRGCRVEEVVGPKGAASEGTPRRTDERLHEPDALVIDLRLASARIRIAGTLGRDRRDDEFHRYPVGPRARCAGIAVLQPDLPHGHGLSIGALGRRTIDADAVILKAPGHAVREQSVGLGQAAESVREGAHIRRLRRLQRRGRGRLCIHLRRSSRGWSRDHRGFACGDALDALAEIADGRRDDVALLLRALAAAVVEGHDRRGDAVDEADGCADQPERRRRQLSLFRIELEISERDVEGAGDHQEHADDRDGDDRHARIEASQRQPGRLLEVAGALPVLDLEFGETNAGIQFVLAQARLGLLQIEDELRILSIVLDDVLDLGWRERRFRLDRIGDLRLRQVLIENAGDDGGGDAAEWRRQAQSGQQRGGRGAENRFNEIWQFHRPTSVRL